MEHVMQTATMHLPLYKKGRVAVSEGVSALEEAASREIGADHIVCVRDPSMALRAALFYTGLGPGCDVLVSAFGKTTPGPDVAGVGARPSYVDIADCVVLSRKCLEEKIEREYTLRDGVLVHRRRGGVLKAVIMTHPMGYSPFVDDVEDFANEHGLLLIDDARDALLCRTWSTRRSRWITPGTGGHAGVISWDGVAFFVAQDPDLVDAVRHQVGALPETEANRARDVLDRVAALRVENIRVRRNTMKVLSEKELAKPLPAPVWSEPATPEALVWPQGNRDEVTDAIEEMGFSVETEFWPFKVLKQVGRQFSYRKGKCEESEEFARGVLAVSARR